MAEHSGAIDPLPEGVVTFEAPDLLLLHTVLVYHSALVADRWCPRVLILRIGRLSLVDRRGLLVLRSLLLLCHDRRTRLLVCDVRPIVRRMLVESGFLDDLGPLNLLPSLPEAIQRARTLLRAGCSPP